MKRQAYNCKKMILSIGCMVLLLFSSPIFAVDTLNAIRMLENLSTAYPALTKMITGFCYLVGFIFIIRGVFYLKMYGELRTMMSSQTSVKIPITLLLVGSLFIFLPSTYVNISISFFGSSSVLSYDKVQTSMNPALLKALVGLVQIIGLISFIRGWMILVAHAQSPGGQASVGKAISHIIGGLCAYNVLGFTNIIWSTLTGGNLIS